MTNVMIRNGHPINRVLDNLFDDFFTRSLASDSVAGGFAPRVNVRETEHAVHFTFELPGMTRDDIKVNVKNGQLEVSGKRDLESRQISGNLIRSEIFSGSFQRSFTLPDTLNLNTVAAEYANGLLEVSIEKLEEVKPKEIEVRVK